MRLRANEVREKARSAHAAPQVGEPSRARAVPRDFGWLLLVSYLLGLVMLVSAGIYDGPWAGPALILVLVALTLVGGRLVSHLRRPVRAPLRFTSAWPLPAGVLGLGVFVIAGFFDARLLLDAVHPWTLLRASQVIMLLLLASYVPGLTPGRGERAALRNARFALFAILVLVCGFDTISCSPHPHIDVWTTHTSGARAFLNGQNPYLSVWTRDTGPGADPIPYVYPPTTIYACALGLLLGGDVRYAMLACLVVTGLAMRQIARSTRLTLPAFAEDAHALFFWLTPKLFFVLEQSWNDCIPLALISLAVLAKIRHRPMLCAAILGLSVTAKQSMFWIVPLGGVLLGFGVQEWLVFLASAAATELPYVLWNFRALKYANFDFLVGQPPRLDALTPINWLYRHLGIKPTGLPGTLLGASAVVLSAARLPRTVPMFSLALLASYFLFFVFNKWAFCNYYFFLMGAASLAAATSIALAAPEPAVPSSLDGVRSPA